MLKDVVTHDEIKRLSEPEVDEIREHGTRKSPAQSRSFKAGEASTQRSRTRARERARTMWPTAAPKIERRLDAGEVALREPVEL